jgi:uncharacterized Zn finger protein (UPF0148 family)
MNLGAIFIGLAILVMTVPFVINPLVNERKRQPFKATPQKKDEQGGQKDALAAIRDLDFDFHTGKVNQDDYETLRAQLALEAAAYLQKKQQEEEKVDALIRARLLQGRATAKCEKCGGDIGTGDLFCPACGVPANNQAVVEKAVVKLACPICGKTIKEKDLFCTRCGTRVNQQPASEKSTSSKLEGERTDEAILASSCLMDFFVLPVSIATCKRPTWRRSSATRRCLERAGQRQSPEPDHR